MKEILGQNRINRRPTYFSAKRSTNHERRKKSVPLPVHRSEDMSSFVVPGQVITSEPGFVRGHGTFVTEEIVNDGGVVDLTEMGDIEMDEGDNNNGNVGSNTGTTKSVLIASVMGSVDRINQLIKVSPNIATTQNKAYVGSTGHLVIGRIQSVLGKRWTVEIGGSKLASLPLTSVNLNDGSQRVRTQEDSMEMRALFAEGDLVAGEVSKETFGGEGATLHSRSLRYGRLENGHLVVVPRGCVIKMPKHFLKIDREEINAAVCDVDVLVGCNGYVWVTRTFPKEWREAVSDSVSEAENYNMLKKKHAECQFSLEEMSILGRVRNSVEVLGMSGFHINKKNIAGVYLRSLEMGMNVGEMLGREEAAKLTAKTARK